MNTPNATEAERPRCFGLASIVYDQFTGGPDCKSCVVMRECFKRDKKREARTDLRIAERDLVAARARVEFARERLADFELSA